MLQIKVPAREFFNENTQCFENTKEQVMTLEHSLVSISKWESKWHKPFINNNEKKTLEETIDYIKCMTISQNIDESVYLSLTKDNIKEINSYMENPMTATWFNDNNKNNKSPNREQITSELIYYWMISLNIPFECQKWHLNKLLTLIRICNLKNKPPKKQSRRETLSTNAALNAARKKELGTSG